VLITLGVLAINILVLVVSALVAYGEAEKRLAGPGSSDTARILIGLLVTLFLAVLFIVVGLRLLRGRRRLGLFLRRFGFGAATATISRTLAGSVGRSWRMVTLDDARVTPIGAARRHTWLLGPLAIASALAISALLTVGVSLLVGDPWGLVVSTTEPGTGGFLGDEFGEAIGRGIFEFIILGLLAPVAMTVAVISGGSFLATRRAQRRATVHIAEGGQIAPISDLVHRRSRRVFASRLVVANVADSQWRPTVRAFAGVCDAVIIDVSQPSEHLLWELHAMRAFFGDRWVLVCHRDRVRALTEQIGTAAPQRQLATLIDGHDVLVYGDGSADRRRFARTLRRRLALAVASR
jgi:hypothetical protein